VPLTSRADVVFGQGGMVGGHRRTHASRLREGERPAVEPAWRCSAVSLVFGPELFQQCRFLRLDLKPVDDHEETCDRGERGPGTSPYRVRYQQSRHPNVHRISADRVGTGRNQDRRMIGVERFDGRATTPELARRRTGH